VCVSECVCVCVCVHVCACNIRREEDIKFIRADIISIQCRCWEPRLGPQEEQQDIWTTNTLRHTHTVLIIKGLKLIGGSVFQMSCFSFWGPKLGSHHVHWILIMSALMNLSPHLDSEVTCTHTRAHTHTQTHTHTYTHTVIIIKAL